MRIAANGSAGVWIYNMPGVQQVFVGPAGTALGGGSGNEVPLGIATIGGDIYVATASNITSSGAGTDIDDPSDPRSGAVSFQGDGGVIRKIGSAGVQDIAQWNPTCAGIDRCMVAGSDSLYYVQKPANGTAEWRITRLAVETGSDAAASPVVTQVSGPEAPFGLDADQQYVAWSTTQGCVQNITGGANNCDITECNVGAFDTTDPMAMPNTLLSTTQFACVDAKLSNGYVYFAIVGVYSHSGSMYGRGIGRVKISDGTVETVDLGIRGPSAGPRRIFPLGDQLYLVDPLVMARIPASALDGKHDFTP